MIRSLVILVVFFSAQVLAQKDLDEVKVVDSIRYKLGYSAGILSYWNKSDIERMQAEDVGTVLQRSAGVSLKSYGGLGGMKTIAVRGLGGEHTTLVVDGFSMSQPHIGQYDLSQIMACNIQRISIVTGMTKQLAPVSSVMSGNSINIETFENSLGAERDAFRVSSRIGSFRQIENYASYKRSSSRAYVSGFGRYRYSLGNYDYTLQNGNQQLNGTRVHNEYQAINGGLSVGVVTKLGLFQGSLRKDDTNQQLPGAVILYSDNSGQYLNTNNLRVQSALSGEHKSLMYKLYAAGVKGSLQYIDSTFLNLAGVLAQQYKNDFAQFGATFALRLNQQLVSFGFEQQLSRLEANTSFTGIPTRVHHFSFVSWKGQLGPILASASLNQQIVLSVQHDVKANVYALKPIVQLEFPFSKGKLTSWGYLTYKSTMRMPTFYELYYNQMGNLNLLPERANQFVAGVVFSKQSQGIEFRTRLNAYRNYVSDKIVAIPTKNLFTWSVQNIGNVIIDGVELIQDFNVDLPYDFEIKAQANYAYQRALDMTNRNSPTYRNQIAYMPKHTANLDLNLENKGNSLQLAGFISSKRYCLNENVESNELQGFMIFDLGLYKVLKRANHTLKLGVMCKNVFGSQYAFVRNYVMPGRNYLFSLSYAFN